MALYLLCRYFVNFAIYYNIILDQLFLIAIKNPPSGGIFLVIIVQTSFDTRILDHEKIVVERI